MRKIRMLRDHDNFAIGEEVTVDDGVADAIVSWACAAVYVDEPEAVPGEPEILPAEKALSGPPAHRMMESGRIRKK